MSVLSLRRAILLNSSSLQIEGRTAIGSKDCPRIFHQMPPFVDIKVNVQRLTAPGMLRNDDLGTALVQVGDDGIGVKGVVSGARTAGAQLPTRRSIRQR